MMRRRWVIIATSLLLLSIGQVTYAQPITSNRQPSSPNTLYTTQQDSALPRTTPLNISNNNSITIIGIYGNSKIGLSKFHNDCIISIIGRRSKKNESPENTSLAFWTPKLPKTLFIIPSTSDINTATTFLYNLLTDRNIDFQIAHSVLVFDNKLYEVKYDNNLTDKFSIMIADMKNNFTENLLLYNNFFIQFYKFRSNPGMTTIRFELDGFTEALTDYNKFCEQQALVEKSKTLPPEKSEGINCSDFDDASVIAYDKKYLGKIASQYQSDSIFNEYGTYGSEYSSDSIWNQYGTYGSKYSSQSSFNEYTNTPPEIVQDKTIIGYLTINKYKQNAINPVELGTHCYNVTRKHEN